MMKCLISQNQFFRHFFFVGKLTKEQIKAGYKALQKIDQCITNTDFGDKLIKACDAFYTRVPHSFGMQRPPIIRTKQELKLKIQLLEILGDIEIALKVINKETDNLLNPIDQHYMALNCELKPISHGSEEFKLVDNYTQNTHAKTHNQYKMEVIDVFECADSRQCQKFKDVGNRCLFVFNCLQTCRPINTWFHHVYIAVDQSKRLRKLDKIFMKVITY